MLTSGTVASAKSDRLSVDDYGDAFPMSSIAVVDDFGNLVTGNPSWLGMREEGPFTHRPRCRAGAVRGG